MIKPNKPTPQIGRTYLATNLVNGKQYVGVTVKSVQTRWKCHVQGRHASRLLHEAITEFGENNFEVQVLFEGPVEEAAALEAHYIQELGTFKNGYNRNHGNDLYTVGRKHSNKTKKLLAKASRNRVWTLESRQKLSKAKMGQTASENVRKVVGARNRGKKLSKRTRLLMRKAHLGLKHSEETKRKISASHIKLHSERSR